MGHKRALIVGINYVGTGNDLRGCINDANNIKNMLTNTYGFTDINMLLEKEATTDNIKDKLNWLVSGCRPGDVLYFHYSGHGSQLADTSDPDVEPDGLDEIICPIDLDWKTKVITDDYMKWVFDKVPSGVNLTVVLDSCHSGTALDQASAYQSKREYIKSIESSRYIAPPPDIQKLNDDVELLKDRSVQTRSVDETSLLISGCAADQTSADAVIGNVPQGAATYSLIKTVNDNKGNVTHRSLIDGMNKYLATNGFSQCPELNGHSSLYDNKFLAELDVTPDVINEYVPPDVTAPPVTTQITPTSFITTATKWITNNIVVVVACVAAAIFSLVKFL